MWRGEGWSWLRIAQRPSDGDDGEHVAAMLFWDRIDVHWGYVSQIRH
jgi:hypothetical protein